MNMSRKKITLMKTLSLMVVLAIVSWLIIGLPQSHANNSALFTLYDGSLGSTPDKQGFYYQPMSLTTLLATQTLTIGGTILNTTGNVLDYAGYLSNPAMMPLLHRATGYTVSFTVQLNSESHVGSDKNGDGKDDRAGFSLIVLSSDHQGIELGFWTNSIWAQQDGLQEPPNGNLFTHAEESVFNTTLLTSYDLTILADSYTLSSGGKSILSGLLRNYTAFNGLLNPYSTPNFLFLGDDTPSAKAKIKLTAVTIHIATATETPTVTATATITPTMTATATETPTVIATATITPTMTATAIETPTVTATATITPTITVTATIIPTMTATATITPTMTATSTPTVSATLTPFPEIGPVYLPIIIKFFRQN